MIERFNITIKEQILNYFSTNNRRTIVDVLILLVDQYNNTIHSSIKITPKEASRKQVERKTKTKCGEHYIHNLVIRPWLQKFSIGDHVRVTKNKKTFVKLYTQRWTKEVFKISNVQLSIPVSYKITDYNGEEIQGSFYEQELQEAKQDIFRIEKIIKQQGNKSLVKWLVYHDSFISWVYNKDIEKL